MIISIRNIPPKNGLCYPNDYIHWVNVLGNKYIGEISKTWVSDRLPKHPLMKKRKISTGPSDTRKVFINVLSIYYPIIG